MCIEMEKINSLLYEFYWSPEGHHIEHNEQWESYYYVSDIWNTIIEHIPPILLISKKFWFIKWLVENEKIDLNEFMHKSRDWDIFNEKLSAKEDDYLSLLMLLSIQDEPIEFLVSILK
jgi:hypothetical protein